MQLKVCGSYKCGDDFQGHIPNIVSSLSSFISLLSSLRVLALQNHLVR